ncbi:hypothetical protein EVAR_64947_1 [Eumeta japonica]|uniref:Uncharacterized protein n=1 Tax=Eumeta variegata TaxID=151549 RepID=A0A4C1ZBS9_EUMVA|nr:hypothetical protein EVAR_64947_1 [Eumeta japonica]
MSRMLVHAPRFTSQLHLCANILNNKHSIPVEELNKNDSDRASETSEPLVSSHQSPLSGGAGAAPARPPPYAEGAFCYGRPFKIDC